MRKPWGRGRDQGISVTSLPEEDLRWEAVWDTIHDLNQQVKKLSLWAAAGWIAAVIGWTLVVLHELRWLP